jgi:hypothetical protein
LTSYDKTNERRVNENHLRVIIRGRGTSLPAILLPRRRERVAPGGRARAVATIASRAAAALVATLVTVRVVAVTSGVPALR